ncbi:hypothetical protein HDE_08826 [Halotydeus destructor]|nr:hypothetical protein HDE_08826 [Halotydeus destructor]
MSIVVDTINSNYLAQCFEVHCVYTLINGSLKDTGTTKSELILTPFCPNYAIQAIVTQGNDIFSAKLTVLDNQDSVTCAYKVFIVRCDGSKGEATSKDARYRLPASTAVQCLHGGNQLVFRFKINLVGNISPGNSSLKKLLDSIDGTFNDFEIQAVGGSIRVMKNILSLKWKYFETMMDSQLMEYSKGIWVVEDISVKIMKDVVGYVYCDAITIESEDHAIKLAMVGHLYLLNDLLDASSSYLVAELNPYNVLRLLVLSDTYSLTVLKKKCFMVIPEYLAGKGMKDLNGYASYIKYTNHARLTEACFENTARRMMEGKRKLADCSLD